MIDQQRIRASIAISALLGLIVCALIYVAARKVFEHDITNIIILIAGMLSAATLSNLSRIFDGQIYSNSAMINFDEARTRQVVDLIIDADFEVVNKNRNEKRDTWEPTTDTLLGQDPNLALAKLRIDLERELRRIASTQDVSLDARKISVAYLLESLARNEIIGRDVVSAIKEILPVCNSAIHGGNVKIDVAVKVLDIGADILRILSTYPRARPIGGRAINGEV